MTTIREFSLMDLFKFNRTSFEPLTEVYELSYYLSKILEFPLLSETAIAPDGQFMGFLIGCRTVETNNRIGDEKDNNHGHVCVLSIGPDYRCLGLGTTLMKRFSDKLELKDDLFVDLFVRSRNVKAIRLYKTLGYEIYCKMYRFYKNDDGYDMRLPLSRDVKRTCLRDKDSPFEILLKLLRLFIKYLLKLWHNFFGNEFSSQ